MNEIAHFGKSLYYALRVFWKLRAEKFRYNEQTVRLLIRNNMVFSKFSIFFEMKAFICFEHTDY